MRYLLLLVAVLLAGCTVHVETRPSWWHDPAVTPVGPNRPAPAPSPSRRPWRGEQVEPEQNPSPPMPATPVGPDTIIGNY